MRFILLASILVVFSLATAGAADTVEETNTQSTPAKIATAPLPKVTPYDAHRDKRDSYLVFFGYGYDWAKEKHLYCPPDMWPGQDQAVVGWIDGYRKGVEEGGTNSMPSKYMKYLKLNMPKP